MIYVKHDLVEEIMIKCDKALELYRKIEASDQELIDKWKQQDELTQELIKDIIFISVYQVKK